MKFKILRVMMELHIKRDYSGLFICEGIRCDLLEGEILIIHLSKKTNLLHFVGEDHWRCEMQLVWVCLF